jgi:AcrR family transcriptional regulator
MASRKPADERRREIADATLGLAARLGPERLTVRDVAAALAISEPAVFRHFASKDALWQAVIERLAERLGERWQTALDEPAPPLATLRALLRGQLSFVAAEPGVPAILLSGELHRRSPALRRALFALMLRFQQLLEGLVAQAQAEGALVADTTPARIAAATIALLQGIILRWSVSGRAFDLVAEGMLMLELLLAGLNKEAA